MKSATDTTLDRFEADVLQRSHELPVLVDFWAPWCGPCRMLGPVLEELAEEMTGAFALVKVNTDAEPELGQQFEVSSIPYVVLFRDGRPVDAFVGALAAPQVKAFLRPHCKSEAAQIAAGGLAKLDAGDLAGAEVAFDAALASEPELASAHLGKARVAMIRRDLDAVELHLGRIPLARDEHEAAQALRDALDLVRAAALAGSPEALQARADRDPRDAAALFALGGHAIADGQLRLALQRYLDVARIDRKWDDEAARRASLVVFRLLGVRHPTSDEFRDELAKIYL